MLAFAGEDDESYLASNHHEQKFIEDEFCEWGLLNNKDKAL